MSPTTAAPIKDRADQRMRVGDWLALGLVTVVMVVLVGPIVLLTIFSFNDSTIISLPFEGFTTEWYTTALADPAVRDSLRNSIIVASIVAPACVVLGTAAAWGITRFRFATRALWTGLVGAPLVVPWLVIGVSGLVFFVYLEIELSLMTVTAMHIAVTFPLVTALVSARLVRFERSQEEAAIDLGASQLQLMTKVVLPQLTPALAASLIFAFAWSFNNFEISFFNGGYEETFPVWVYAVLRRSYNLPVVNAIATLVSFIQVLAVYALYLFIKWLGKRRGSGDNLTTLVGGVR
ncbi:ABC transporter permease [Nocardioides bigeumensis]|uniref:ABC transporter permease n=1 Tax=Nocardioides bigeumensis TaxID=433657 RepID=A0ABN2YZW0_9ACTN